MHSGTATLGVETVGGRCLGAAQAAEKGVVWQGEDLLKHGRHGRPKMHYFRLIDNDTRLSWRSAKGVLRSVSLRHVLQACRPPPLPQAPRAMGMGWEGGMGMGQELERGQEDGKMGQEWGWERGRGQEDSGIIGR